MVRFLPGLVLLCLTLQVNAATMDLNARLEESLKTETLKFVPVDAMELAEVPQSDGGMKDLSFSNGFFPSISMILVSELGDKTFFIAAVMAMRHNRLVVFSAAISALALMTALSAAMGYTLPNLLPRKYTHMASIGLFLVFGVRLLIDAFYMDPEEPNEELEEVELELGQHDVEHGKTETDEDDTAKKNDPQIMRRCFSPVFIQAFTMTFLAEWGDRSQIATIALAAAKNPFGVTLGGIIGHSCCTGLAVIGGKLLATKISERMVATIGGILFFIFAFHSIYAGPEGND